MDNKRPEEEFYGKSILEEPKFSIVDMSHVLNENKTLGLRIKDLESELASRIQLSNAHLDTITVAHKRISELEQVARGMFEAGNKIRKYHAFIPDAEAWLKFEECLAAARPAIFKEGDGK